MNYHTFADKIPGQKHIIKKEAGKGANFPLLQLTMKIRYGKAR